MPNTGPHRLQAYALPEPQLSSCYTSQTTQCELYGCLIHADAALPLRCFHAAANAAAPDSVCCNVLTADSDINDDNSRCCSYSYMLKQDDR